MVLQMPVEHYKSDVLVIGGGAAGAMACFECANADVSVILAVSYTHLTLPTIYSV